MKEARHRRPLSESFASLSIAITSKRSSSESLASLSGRDQQTKQTELSPLPLTGALAPFLPTTQFQGYRVISVDIPRVWSHHEWIQAFEKFLDAIDIHHIMFMFSFYAYSNLMHIINFYKTLFSHMLVPKQRFSNTSIRIQM